MDSLPHLLLVVEVLHDIDFATIGPATARSQQPDSRPHSICTIKAGAHLYIAVSERKGFIGKDTAAGKGLLVTGLAALALVFPVYAFQAHKACFALLARYDKGIFTRLVLTPIRSVAGHVFNLIPFLSPFQFFAGKRRGGELILEHKYPIRVRIISLCPRAKGCHNDYSAKKQLSENHDQSQARATVMLTPLYNIMHTVIIYIIAAVSSKNEYSY